MSPTRTVAFDQVEMKILELLRVTDTERFQGDPSPWLMVAVHRLISALVFRERVEDRAVALAAVALRLGLDIAPLPTDTRAIVEMRALVSRPSVMLHPCAHLLAHAGAVARDLVLCGCDEKMPLQVYTRCLALAARAYELASEEQL